MIKNIICLTLLLSLTIFTNAQKLQLTSQEGVAIEDGDILTFNNIIVEGEEAFIKAPIYVKNTSFSPLSAKVKRTVISNTFTESEETFCWSYCYINPPEISDAQQIVFGNTYKDFYGKLLFLNPEMEYEEGDLTVRYTFFDDANPSDSASVIIKYTNNDAGGTSIDKNVFAENMRISSLNKTLSLDYDFADIASNKDLKISILNVSGKTLRTISAKENRAVVEINLSDLPWGVYLFTISNGKTLLTSRKFVLR
ncbi:hypothetical protein AwDysgo_10880 [Bacteroidales bacterium]|nr:hypothetical protein AwDysgo_10880 [Bacteroidales bacterium]